MKIHKIFFAYKLYMMIYLLAAFNCFFNGGILLKIGTIIAALFGGILILYVVFKWKTYRKMPNFILCILFLISYVISSILNIKYGITENIQAFLWLTCQIGLLYIASYDYTSEMMKRELKILSSIYVIWCSLANLISISMIQWGYEYKITDSQNQSYWIGYTRGRLWGVYNDPNHGAVITVIAIICLLYLWSCYQKKWQKICILISGVINILYIGFSNSRTAMIAFGAGILCWSFLSVFRKKKRWTVSVLISMMLAVVAVGGLAAFENVNAKVYQTVQSKHQINNGTNANHKGNKNKLDARKKELEKDSSNGRIDIWESGIEIAKTSPIYGVSFRNMVAYSKENLPKTYIVNNDLGDYDSLHNMFVDIVVSQGMIGIVITLLLIGNTIRILYKNLSKFREKDYDILIFSFTIVTAIVAASQFYSYIFYLHSPQTYIFWMCMGYLMALSKWTEERNIEVE